MLKRDDLERELVRKDKQALITDCLKLFDSNRRLTEVIEQLDHKNDAATQEAKFWKKSLETQKGKSWVQVLNDRIREKTAIIKRRKVINK